MKIYLITLIALVIVIFVSSSIQLSTDEMKGVLQEVRRIIPAQPSPDVIFANNFRVLLMMLIPGLGIGLGGFAIFSTGLVFGAVGQCNSMYGSVLVLGTMLTPFFWLEFIAYAAVITQNIFLLKNFIARDFFSRLPATGGIFLFASILLVLGAIVESLIIASFSMPSGSRFSCL